MEIVKVSIVYLYALIGSCEFIGLSEILLAYLKDRITAHFAITEANYESQPHVL